MTITLSDVSKVIKGNTVVDNVSMTMKSGQIVGLRGYNGCGKTMLMRLVSGLIHVSEGAIDFDGKRLGKDLDFPEALGILIENPAFLGGFTGFQNLRMLASMRGNVPDAQIRNALVRVGLSPDDSRKYRKYSLGMKQRLGIAAAIMEAPSFLILDEPTNALDADGVEMLKQIAREEQKRGAVILMTCHDADVLDTLCDKIYEMEQGHIKCSYAPCQEVGA